MANQEPNLLPVLCKRWKAVHRKRLIFVRGPMPQAQPQGRRVGPSPSCTGQAINTCLRYYSASESAASLFLHGSSCLLTRGVVPKKRPAVAKVNLSAGEEVAGELGAGRFDPTEDELVLHFLRPQLRGFPPRVAGAVLEADPCGAAPWELLARYGLREQGHFFAARRRRRPLVRRAVAGAGAWAQSSTRRGQSVTDLGVVVRWSRADFRFNARREQQRGAGWVMEEYEITDPRCYRRRDEEGEEDDYWVLCRVRRSSNAAAAKPASTGKVRWRSLDELEADSGVKAKVSRPLRT